nr:MAG TPA: hypothetical protein [Caudoviricetes sp.]
MGCNCPRSVQTTAQNVALVGCKLRYVAVSSCVANVQTLRG